MGTINTTIIVKKGLEANRLGITPVEGELLYTTDQKRFYVGDGVTAGGKLVAPEKLSEILDVDLTSPTNNQVLSYNSSAQKWIAVTFDAANATFNNATSGLVAVTIQAAIDEIDSDLDTHISDTENPHSVTTTQIGAIPTTQKGVANGVATLGADSKIPVTQLPAIAITDVFVVADITARDALTVQEGDVAIVSDAGSGQPNTYIYDGTTWLEMQKPADVVSSVNGQTGVVSLTYTDVGAEVSGAVSTHETTYNHASYNTAVSNLASHTSNTTNPHSVTTAQIGAEPAFTKNTAFNKNFSGTGSETNVARSDHNHNTTYEAIGSVSTHETTYDHSAYITEITTLTGGTF